MVRYVVVGGKILLVSANGQLGGYAGGTERKLKLLALEKAHNAVKIGK